MKKFAMFAMLFVLAGMLLPAQAQTVTTLYDFATNSSVSQEPAGVVAQGRDGNFYGITQVPNRGTIYKVTPSGTFTLLHIMASDLSEGANCNGLILGSDGNFYGTCLYGGNGAGNGLGTIIKVTPAGVLTVIYKFTGQNAGGSTDGCYPFGVPVQASDGNFYGTAEQCGTSGGYGVVYKLTMAGVYTVIYNFSGGGQPFGALIQGSDGNLWGTTTVNPTVFKVSTAGVFSTVYSFGCCGTPAQAGLVQGPDGNYYGTTEAIGANTQGEVFKVTPAGVLTVLHSFNNTTDHGAFPVLPLTLGTDGNFYGVATDCGGGGCSALGANIFEITSKGLFTDLYNFPNIGSNNNSVPESPLFLSTNGTFYSTTQLGGTVGDGTFYSLTNAQSAFIALQQSSGKVGSKIGILGQGFGATSVVKFNGVTATTVVRTGTTFLTATVPAGATDGFVTVTTGATTLTSRGKFLVHNTWASGKVMPTGTAFSSAAVLGGEIYVIGGAKASGTVINNVQIYNPTTNTWSTGTSLPTVTQHSSAAVVSNILYVFGGDNGVAAPTNAVLAYSPKTKAWTSMAPMPTARNGTLAVVEKNIIYVMGGNLGNGSNFVATVESYNPATNTWTTEAPMDGAKDYPAGGLIGTTIVAADGAVASGQITGDTEGYNAATNAWSELTADPTARTGSCSGVIGSALYDASGYINNNGAATTVNDSYSLSANKWTTTLLSIPQGTMYAAPAVDNGQLYCLGGWATISGTTINNVQIYQP